MNDFVNTLEPRAEYLYDCYNRIKKNTKYISYLDVGCGYGINTSIFGRSFNETVCFDISTEILEECKRRIASKNNKKIFFVKGDAQLLPFKREYFNLVSAFSLIEHVSDKQEILREMLDVLKKDGELLLQFPNKYFFIDLHTGIPLYSFFPSFIRLWILRKIGYDGKIDIPTVRQIEKMIKNIGVSVEIRKSKIVYPLEVIPQKMKWIYRIMKRLGVLSLVPLGWMVCIRKLK